MIRPHSTSARRAAILVAALLLAVPASAWFQRTTVYFLASFDGPIAPVAPGVAITADIGQFNPVTPPPTFTVVSSGNGGELKVSDGGTVADAKLYAIFSKVFNSSYLVLDWQMQTLQPNSGLVFRVDDAGEQGILDCTWGGGGVTVNGAQATAMIDASSAYDVTLTLTQSLLGVATWQLQIREGDWLVASSAGVLNLGGPLTVKQIEIIRPAGQPAGTFLVDEIKATSYDFLSK